MRRRERKHKKPKRLRRGVEKGNALKPSDWDDAEELPRKPFRIRKANIAKL